MHINQGASFYVSLSLVHSQSVLSWFPRFHLSFRPLQVLILASFILFFPFSKVPFSIFQHSVQYLAAIEASHVIFLLAPLVIHFTGFLMFPLRDLWDDSLVPHLPPLILHRKLAAWGLHHQFLVIYQALWDSVILLLRGNQSTISAYGP
jgi:hypothetical protein